jgi:hypothetical protein
MYEKIKTLADEAIALQNKNRMDAVLREISALCDQPAPVAAPAAMDAGQFEAAELAQHKAGKPAFANLKTPEPKESEVVLGVKSIGDGYEMVTYGTAKTFDSEAEMIADIQGAPSPVFPLERAKPEGKSVPAKQKGAKK